jgi:predicted N-formylglutamate amidohydrolase
LDGDHFELTVGETDWWTVHRGDSPVVATAIHNGRGVPRELAGRMSLPAEDRLREEDPYTEFIIRDVPNRIVVHRSRFAVDLNRSHDQAIYLRPEQSWGLMVWSDQPDGAMIAEALRFHDGYYRMLETMLRGVEAQVGRFVVLDVHSYNHRRDGPDAPPAPPETMPEVNIGTFSMDRRRWSYVLDPLIERLGRIDVGGRRLTVRENVAFQGRGEQTRFVHEKFPETGCAIAIEFRKSFMDEWTGVPDREALTALRAVVRSLVSLLESILEEAR